MAATFTNSDLPAIRDVIIVSGSRYFPAVVAKTYVVAFRSHNDDRPSKFIVEPMIENGLSRWLGTTESTYYVKHIARYDRFK